ncbi:two-component system capsular synthesis response regulator RcsB [Luteimonas terrae]|uniref:Two-component system capsular synthesis response regulator RcsB n=2 Tax=Luteimonas terrae TaxID=1530191 RepID=A0ABU1XTY7_9GAMM|nr:two-component system capsular synthesis response regulator RcsB [Luteimonas terrae]
MPADEASGLITQGGMMDGLLRIFIADDHPFTLAGVRAEIERAGEALEVAGEASNGAALLTLLEESRPGDLLVTDFSMRGPQLRDCDGLPLLLTLRRQFPSLPIIVLTDLDNPAMLRAVVDAGARGLVDKASARDELLTAIQRVASGRIHFCRAMRTMLDHAGALDGPQVHMSPHEAEVVRLFVTGLSVSEIAARLSRSVKTISRQKNDAMHKLGLDNNCQLYAYARDHGLTP